MSLVPPLNGREEEEEEEERTLANFVGERTSTCVINQLWKATTASQCRKQMLEMFVTNVGVSSHTGSPIVILRDDEAKRLLAITIGQQEAINITRAMSKLSAPRPRPLDILMNFARSTGFFLQDIFIDYLDEETYKATITLASEDGKIQTLDARPSDALALALGNGAPIFVKTELTTEVFERKRRTAPAKDEQFSAFVEKLNPSDFAKLGVSVNLPEDDESAA